MALARTDELRQGPARTSGARLPRRGACTFSRSSSRGAGVSAPLELAARALQAAEGDEAEAFVHVERSGLARFADSEQHQPTLVENTVVTLRVVRDGRVGIAITNRTGD